MSSITVTPHGTTFAGPEAVSVFRALTVASALKLYARTGMKANRAYTPAKMMRVAREITGKNFKARDYLLAAEALREWAGKTAATLEEEA